MKAKARNKDRIVRACVDGRGGVIVQMALGERPLTANQMNSLKRAIAKNGSETYGRQVTVNMRTHRVEVVLRKNEV